MQRNECAPAEASDCTQSLLCRELGKCSLKGKSCALLSDADCARTSACTTTGKKCGMTGKAGEERCADVCTTYGFKHDCL